LTIFAGRWTDDLADRWTEVLANRFEEIVFSLI